MPISVISTDLRVRDLANMLENYSVLFVQQDGVLMGSVTNGDFRRGIARGVSLDDAVVNLMNSNPLAIHEKDGYKTRLERVKRLPQGLRYLPVVNDRGEILQVVSDKALMVLPNVALIMAGGLGSRLKSLTASLPKPMLKIGDKPILQLIVEQFRRAGISRFLISVNYQAEIIKEYFKDGGEFEVQIEYLHETQRLGTAGCLSLLQEVPGDTMLVMNGDVLTDLNPQDLLQHHQKSGASATVCLHDYEFTIPYGVVRTERNMVQSIDEKPKSTHRINAGIYAINPECVLMVPRGEYLDMTSLLERMLQQGLTLSAYSLSGYWIDIGNADDFQRANHEYRDSLESLP